MWRILLFYIIAVTSVVAESEQILAIPEDKCTAIAVARGATVDDSTMTTHTMDCFECDWRVNKVINLVLNMIASYFIYI